MNFKFFIIPALLLSLFILSCTNPCRKFDEIISNSLSDKKISEEEWTRIKQFAETNKINLKECNANIFNVVTVDDIKLKEYIIKKAEQKNVQNITFSDNTSLVQPEINIFLENSGSMNGFVTGNTKFESAVMKMITDLDFYFNNKTLYYINEDLFPANKTVENFVKEMNPESLRKIGTKGERGSTETSSIFKRVLKTMKKGQICILISDCQFSIRKKNPKDLLNSEMNLTKLAFQKKLQQFDITTVVLQLVSDFNGNYYYWDEEQNSEVSAPMETPRPYYIWIMGDNDVMNVFFDKVKMTYLRTLDGFTNCCLFTSLQTNFKIYFTLLDQTNKLGDFKIDRNTSNMDFDNGMIDITTYKRNDFNKNVFQFALAVDFSKFLGDSTYLLDSQNYCLKAKDKFEIRIENKDNIEINQNDKIKIRDKTITHVITVKSNKIKVPNQSLQITLMNNLPNWIEESNAETDLGGLNKSKKTFGISYLINGVFQSYKNAYPNIDSYCSISLSLKK